MTSPDNASPAPAVGGSGVLPLQNVNPQALAQGKNLDLHDMLEGVRGNLFTNLLSGFLNIGEGIQAGVEAVASAILGGFGGLAELEAYEAAQRAIVNDHTNEIEELRVAFNQLILQGNAIVFTSNNTYFPPAGVVSLDLIILGAGAGGGGGRWNFLNGGCGGGGGGGGGEVHTSIPASLLPKTNGVYDPVNIIVGGGGAKGDSSPTSGQGGGHTMFGVYLSAGGGQGGTVGPDGGVGIGGIGGAGMIPGGKGGGGLRQQNGEPGGNSTSAYDLHGGGGGGGGGAQGRPGGPGGIGGISPGGITGSVATRDGTPPSSIVATGGGGGAGGWSDNGAWHAGNGAFPAGGGGGGYGSPTVSGNGGVGGNGVLFVIERFA